MSRRRNEARVIVQTKLAPSCPPPHHCKDGGGINLRETSVFVSKWMLVVVSGYVLVVMTVYTHRQTGC